MPLSDPNQYISIAADEDTEIGILVKPSALDSKSPGDSPRGNWINATSRRQFRKFYRVKEQFGIHEWEVENRAGVRVTFSVRGLNQNIKQVPPLPGFL